MRVYELQAADEPSAETGRFGSWWLLASPGRKPPSAQSPNELRASAKPEVLVNPGPCCPVVIAGDDIAVGVSERAFAVVGAEMEVVGDPALESPLQHVAIEQQPWRKSGIGKVVGDMNVLGHVRIEKADLRGNDFVVEE